MGSERACRSELLSRVHARRKIMKSLVKWCVALAAVASLVTLAGAWSSQDSGKKPQAQEAAAKARMEHMNALMKAMPTLKTPLSEAITLAEKERKGKAHGADVELGKDGKLKIEVRRSEERRVGKG